MSMNVSISSRPRTGSTGILACALCSGQPIRLHNQEWLCYRLADAQHLLSSLCHARRFMLLCAVAFAPLLDPVRRVNTTRPGPGLSLQPTRRRVRALLEPAGKNEVIAHHEGLL